LKIAHKLIYIYKAEKPSVCLSVCHINNSSGTAGFDPSGAYHKVLIICLLLVCYRKFTRASSCSLKCVEGESVKKFEHHSFENHSRQCSDGRALDLQTKSCWFKSQQLLALLFSSNHTFWTHVSVINF